MTENNKTIWWRSLKFVRSSKFWSMFGAGAFSLVLVGILTQQFTFKTGLFEWINFEALKAFKEVVIPIVTAPVLLVVWWLRVVHHEETLAAQQKTNEIAEKTAETAQIVANNEKEFKIYERRYAELNDIKASLVTLKPLIFNETTFQLENPNDHTTKNAAILALARLTDFLQEDEAHLQPIRRAAFILLKQTWASYVRESYEQVKKSQNGFIREDENLITTNEFYNQELYRELIFVDYKLDSIIQQLTKTLLRGLKSKNLTEDGLYVKAELNQPIFKDELSDLWLIGMNTELVPDICFYVEDVDFKGANFSFSILNNIHFERIYLDKLYCFNTLFSKGKIYFNKKNNLIEYLGIVKFSEMMLSGINNKTHTINPNLTLSQLGENPVIEITSNIISNMQFEIQFFYDNIKYVDIENINEDLNIISSIFKNTALRVSNNTESDKKSIHISNCTFIDCTQNPLSLSESILDNGDVSFNLSNINYFLNFDYSHVDRFLEWQRSIPHIKGIFKSNVYQFTNEQDQNHVFAMTDIITMKNEIKNYVETNKIKMLA